ncbi:hypothetical protein [Methanocella sp. MCL-LM]|uniref:hypothetical protein n=1 Tax=Methanocella sp. MCL-LM TaxID=3412035 RepID=UPI003C75A564
MAQRLRLLLRQLQQVVDQHPLLRLLLLRLPQVVPAVRLQLLRLRLLLRRPAAIQVRLRLLLRLRLLALLAEILPWQHRTLRSLNSSARAQAYRMCYRVRNS